MNPEDALTDGASQVRSEVDRSKLSGLLSPVDPLVFEIEG